MQKLSDNQFIILASKSPRRKYLLKQAGLSFTVIPSSIDENSVPISQPKMYVKTLAEAKANDVSNKFPESWVIGADTIVLINGLVLGKPSSKTEARVMLKQLQKPKPVLC